MIPKGTKTYYDRKILLLGASRRHKFKDLIFFPVLILYI
jgi:hypothetical protein